MNVLRRYAVKIYYNGRGLHGFQPQKDRRTVAGEIISALQKSGLLEGVLHPSFQAASRTDREVSALGQVVAFSSFKVLSTERINAFLPESIRAWAWAEVPFGFNPRKEAKERVYVFINTWRGESLELMRNAASLLTEKYILGSYNGKNGEIHPKKLRRIALSLRNRHIYMRFHARSFERGSVRRLANAILKVGRLKINVYQLANPQIIEKLALAPPENLILLRVKYGLKFSVDEQSKTRLKSKLADEVCLSKLKELSLRNLK